MSPVSSMKLYARGRSFVRFWRGVTRCLKIKMDDYMALLLLLLLHGIAYAYLLLVEEQARRRRRFWVRPWIARRDEPDLPNMADFYEELISVGSPNTWSALSYNHHALYGLPWSRPPPGVGPLCINILIMRTGS